MYRVELYAEVRRSVYVEGLSERGAARRFGLARETVRKMLRYSVPPGYRRAHPVRCPKLDGFTGVIDQILGDDQQRPKKQRHTAKRIWERLRAEHAFTGGYTIVKDYVREQTLGGQEMFVKRPQFSWTLIRGESNVQGGGGNGSIEERAGEGVGGDGGSPEGDRSARRRRGR